MKLQTVTSRIGHSAYALWNNGRKLFTLVFNQSSNAARVEFADEKRVFLIRKEGLLRNRTVLCNEYGVRIGHTGSEHNRRFIVINDQRYFYQLDKSEPALSIYKDPAEQPVAVCKLEGSNPSQFRDRAQHGLLMTICWCLFQPAVHPQL